MRETLHTALRQLTKAQKERASLTRIGLSEAAARAHDRAQAYRAIVRQLRDMGAKAARGGER